MAVIQIRDGLTLRRLISERFTWGRLFGGIRSHHASMATRLGWLAATPLMPMVLFGRFLRDRLQKRERAASIIAVGPAVALLQSVWVIGEAAGYLAGRSRRHRD